MLSATDVRPRYRTLRLREQAFVLASEDLCPLLDRYGLTQQQTTLMEEAENVTLRVRNIKDMYSDVVSNVSAEEEAERNALINLSATNRSPPHQLIGAKVSYQDQHRP